MTKSELIKQELTIRLERYERSLAEQLGHTEEAPVNPEQATIQGVLPATPQASAR